MKIILLRGGLGNQLFQLSKYIYLKKNYNFKDLKIDTRSGFFLDFKYKRKLEIKEIEEKSDSAEISTSIVNIILILTNKYLPIFSRFLNTKIINNKNYFDLKPSRKENLIFDGYFQDFNFIKDNLKEIFNYIKPNFKVNYSTKFEKLFREIKQFENSVAIGIRFYEESKNPKVHANPHSKVKKIDDYNNLIKKLEENLKNPKFYIFVQHENDFTSNLNFNSQYFIISHEKGYKGSWARLKAQSLCKHHIFNNSTFYYWGAIFSTLFHENKDFKPQIYISNNFVFRQIYNSNWEKF